MFDGHICILIDEMQQMMYYTNVYTGKLILISLSADMMQSHLNDGYLIINIETKRLRTRIETRANLLNSIIATLLFLRSETKDLPYKELIGENGEINSIVNF